MFKSLYSTIFWIVFVASVSRFRKKAISLFLMFICLLLKLQWAKCCFDHFMFSTLPFYCSFFLLHSCLWLGCFLFDSNICMNLWPSFSSFFLSFVLSFFLSFFLSLLFPLTQTHLTGFSQIKIQSKELILVQQKNNWK